MERGLSVGGRHAKHNTPSRMPFEQAEIMQCAAMWCGSGRIQFQSRMFEPNRPVAYLGGIGRLRWRMLKCLRPEVEQPKCPWPETSSSFRGRLAPQRLKYLTIVNAAQHGCCALSIHGLNPLPLTSPPPVGLTLHRSLQGAILYGTSPPPHILGEGGAAFTWQHGQSRQEPGETAGNDKRRGGCASVLGDEKEERGWGMLVQHAAERGWISRGAQVAEEEVPGGGIARSSEEGMPGESEAPI